jgi:hypothetical protein
MVGLSRFCVPIWPFVALPVVTAALLGTWAYREARTAPRTGGARAGEDMAITELVERLRAGGLTLRVVGADKAGADKNNAFLTTSKKTWEQLVGLPKSREAIDRWEGVVSCERMFLRGTRDIQMQIWGDCCLQVGSYLFFGDRDLLARIRACLRVPDRRG